MLAVFFTVRRNRMIVYFEANRSVYIFWSKFVNTFKSIVADKKVFARVTFRRVQLKIWRTSDLKERNKTGAKFPRISFTFHFKLSAQHTVWMYCKCTVALNVFTLKWKEHARSTDTHLVAPCFLITKIGRSLTFTGRMFRKAVYVETGWPPCLR